MKLSKLSFGETGLLAAITALLATFTTLAADPAPNQLSAEEKAGGWKLLFDGKTTDGWRAGGKKAFPEKGWEVEDGWLHCLGLEGGGDIVTLSSYDQFEIKWEWKQARGGNSGLKYFVTEKGASVIGHEYQLIDNDEHPDAKAADG